MSEGPGSNGAEQYEGQNEAGFAGVDKTPRGEGSEVSDLRERMEAYLADYLCPSCRGKFKTCTCDTDKAAIRGFFDVEHLEGEHGDPDFLDQIEAMARQHCFTDKQVRTYHGVPEVNITDSGGISTNAYALRMLAEHERFRVVREYGRMVVGYWPQNDPNAAGQTQAARTGDTPCQ